jgi:ribosomal protein L7/L12
MTQLYVVIFCAMLTILVFNARLTQIERRMKNLPSLDAKLDLLLKHSGLEYDPYKNLPPKVAEAVQGGRKIEAIKCYRELAGVDLKEAKAFIEEVQRRGSLA